VNDEMRSFHDINTEKHTIFNLTLSDFHEIWCTLNLYRQVFLQNISSLCLIVIQQLRLKYHKKCIFCML